MISNTDSGTASGDRGVQRGLEHVQAVLVPGETVEAWAIQRRLFALSHRRALLAVTSGRLLYITRKLIVGFDLTDLRWQDLEEVTLHVGLFGATIRVRCRKASDLASESASDHRWIEVRGLRKPQAEAVYRVCQAQDQAWREKRRVRDLEELRARSGGIQLSPGVVGAGPNPGPGALSDSARRLQEARQLLENKLISDAEYEAIKAKILSST